MFNSRGDSEFSQSDTDGLFIDSNADKSSACRMIAQPINNIGDKVLAVGDFPVTQSKFDKSRSSLNGFHNAIHTP
jgi:hypothetical protein